LAVAGCASAPLLRPINVSGTNATDVPTSTFDQEPVVLALSGGGARAAAFSLGALEGLRDLRALDGRSVLDHVRLLAAVSGGSILAAYYGQHGAEGLDGFRAAYLDKNWALQLHTSLISPMNWLRAALGGLNDRALLGDWLDREVYAHGAMRDLWGGARPQIWINATDLYNGVTF